MKRWQWKAYLNEVPKMTIRSKNTALQCGDRTMIMGILNVTPDSFSDGGQYIDIPLAVERAIEMVEQGADVIDIGGESTRPGSNPVDLEEELRRVIPAVEALSRAVDVPISVDTYKAEVARQALAAGAHWINDIWGLRKDPNMADVIVDNDCPIVIMHNRNERNYDNLISDIVQDLKDNIDFAHQAGIKDEQIILDPGIGFAKTIEDNFIVMNHLTEIVQLGYPVLLGVSRKSMIWKTLESAPSEVLEGTLAAITAGIVQGCQIIRVHDVAEAKKAAAVLDAMLSVRGEVDEK